MSKSHLTAVLVHGAWLDSAVWTKVIVLLAHAGMRSFAPSLPMTSLTDDVTALNRVIDRIEGEIVLVGHGYAGAVIGEVRGSKVRAIVYVAALAPERGESVKVLLRKNKPHPNSPLLVTDAEGFVWLPADAVATALAQNAPAVDQRLLAAVQRPISSRCFGCSVGDPLWKQRPVWYLVAQDDRMLSPVTQVFMAERMQAVTRSARADHVASFTSPDEIVQLVLEAARRTREI